MHNTDSGSAEQEFTQTLSLCVDQAMKNCCGMTILRVQALQELQYSVEDVRPKPDVWSGVQTGPNGAVNKSGGRLCNSKRAGLP